MSPEPGPLLARTRRLDQRVELLEVAGEEGRLWTRGRAGFAARGVALRVPVPRRDPAVAADAVQRALDSIAVDDEVGLPGCGPVALGSLPFAPEADASLVVPELLVGRADDGTSWVTTIGPADGDRTDTAGLRAPDRPGDPDRPEPSSFVVAPELDPADWCAAVAAARDELRAGVARKVVLARAVTVRADRPISRRAVLGRLLAAFPSCMVYATDDLVGASPELLVARTGDRVRSHPMAGTAPRSSDPSTDARLAADLLASAKDREEHRLTIDMVHDTLLPWCSYLDEEAEPSIVAMANVQHLATRVEGRLSAPPASVIELVLALHPTPAVCGSPTDRALAIIRRLERLDRGGFAGPVGWVDAGGNGEWAVGIRCAELSGANARLFAGVGVVADSDPATELAETQAKLQALLTAIVRP